MGVCPANPLTSGGALKTLQPLIVANKVDNGCARTVFGTASCIGSISFKECFDPGVPDDRAQNIQDQNQLPEIIGMDISVPTYIPSSEMERQIALCQKDFDRTGNWADPLIRFSRLTFTIEAGTGAVSATDPRTRAAPGHA